MATVNKNFRIKNGLIVEGGSATVNGFDVLTKAAGDQTYIIDLIGGQATAANTANTVVKRDGSGNFAAGTITATFVGNVTGDVTGTVSSLSNHDTADLAENASNKYFTDARAITATAASYDVIGAAGAAQAAAVSAAASDATTKANAAQAAAISTASGDATTKANAAQAAAEATAAAALTAHNSDTTDVHGIANTALLATTANVATAKTEAIADAATASASAISAAISTEVSNRNTAIGTAVSNLVDGAPDLLNTLNELAAAINDDNNYTTTITTALGTKAPLASPALTGVPTAPTAAANTDTTQIATTAFAKAEADAAQTAAEATAAADATTKANAAQAAAASDATTKANAAQAAAISAAAADATTKANAAQAAAEATAAAANTAQQNGTTSFTAINYNSVAKQVAATTGNIETVAATTAISWVAADYRSAKLVVKVKNGVHTQVSDLVVTLDTANNVAVSEYGITYSNGTELAAVTADYSGSDVRIRVTPANNNTEVVVVGTLIK